MKEEKYRISVSLQVLISLSSPKPLFLALTSSHWVRESNTLNRERSGVQFPDKSPYWRTLFSAAPGFGRYLLASAFIGLQATDKLLRYERVIWIPTHCPK